MAPLYFVSIVVLISAAGASAAAAAPGTGTASAPGTGTATGTGTGAATAAGTAAGAGAGAVELVVRHGATKALLGEKPVRLAVFPPGGAAPLSLEGRTDGAGKAAFSLATVPAGSAVLATTDHSGGRYHSEPAAMPASGPLSIELVVFEPTSSPAGLAIVAPSRIGLHPYERPVKDFSEDTEVMVRVTAELVVENRGDQAYFPPGGLSFPFPAGATEPDLPDTAFWMELEGNGARYRDYFPPGRTALGWEFSMAPSGGRAALEMTLPFPATDLEIITVLVRPGVLLEGTGFGPSEPATVTSGEGSVPVLRAVAASLAAATPVEIALVGITSKFQLAGWVAVIFGALAILAAIWLSFTSARANPAAAVDRTETALRARRRRLLEDLCRIEEGRHSGKIQPERYQAARLDLVSRIAALDRQMAA